MQGNPVKTNQGAAEGPQETPAGSHAVPDLHELQLDQVALAKVQAAGPETQVANSAAETVTKPVVDRRGAGEKMEAWRG